jgi:5-carboxymethyl-2-hydroxymuconate isomerase
MPHLTVEYSANLEEDVDIAAFCAAMRDAMAATGIFPFAGIRIRAFPCHTYVIADGDPAYAYLHMICRIGAGRDADTRLAAAESIYAAAEGHLRERIGERPVALSLDLDELHPRTSLKRFNTVHEAVAAKERAAAE